MLARYRTADAIPDDAARWEVAVRGAQALAESLRERRKEALLYRPLATLRTDVPLEETLADLEWRGARREELTAVLAVIGDEEFLGRVNRWRA